MHNKEFGRKVGKKSATWDQQVSLKNIRRYLQANRLFGRHARKKPFLSFNHKCDAVGL